MVQLMIKIRSMLGFWRDDIRKQTRIIQKLAPKWRVNIKIKIFIAHLPDFVITISVPNL